VPQICPRREFSIHLKNFLPAMLLNCDLTLQIPKLPDEVARKFPLLHDPAAKMRNRLEVRLGQAASVWCPRTARVQVFAPLQVKSIQTAWCGPITGADRSHFPQK
jgi:hypothetical protein